METNGKNGKNRHGGWPATIDVTESPYLSGIKSRGEANDAEAGQAQVTSDDLPPVVETGRKKSRRRKAVFFCVVVLAGVCIGLGLYAKYGGRKRVDYQVAEKKTIKPQAQQSQSGAGIEQEPVNQITSDAINQAKEEMRKAGMATETGVTPTAQGATVEGSRQVASRPIFTPYIVPDTPVGTTATVRGTSGRGSEQPGNDTAGSYGGGGGRTSASDARQTYQSSGSASAARSIYTVVPERRSSGLNVPGAGRGPRFESRNAPPAENIKLPTFGTLLPVRTMGIFYTLRQASLARFELTRDVAGDGWSLKRGTVLVGQPQGSENDRAFLSLTGFVDPETNRFIRLSGDVLGGDGGPGIKGRRRKIGGVLGPVLNRIANGGLVLGQAALSRGSGTTIIVPGGSLTGFGSDLGLTRSAISRREFVEVPASSPGYIMVTDLPKEVRGVDADPAVEGGALTDEELADLLSSGTPEQIREALPRMSPEMRKVAELVLSGK
jgi:hypothetical protein